MEIMDTQLSLHTQNRYNKTQFSWSVSRHKMFNSCLRKYYLHYYVAKNSQRSMSALVRRVGQAKQQTSLAIWKGTVIHNMIAGILKDYKLGIHTKEDRYLEAKQRFINQMPPSIKPGKFGFGSYDDWEYAAVKEFDELVDAVDENEIFNWLLTLEPEQIIEIDPPFNNFMFEETKTYAIIDVLVFVDDVYYIIDWKTGSIPPMREQGSVYKYYVYDQYQGIHPDNIKVRVGGIGERRNTYARPMDLIETEEFILGSIAEMRSKLDSQGLTRAQDFPMTENEYKCQHCNFRNICNR